MRGPHYGASFRIKKQRNSNKVVGRERELMFKKMFETAQSLELANKEDFRDASVLMDNMVNKVSKNASPGHSK